MTSTRALISDPNMGDRTLKTSSLNNSITIKYNFIVSTSNNFIVIELFRDEVFSVLSPMDPNLFLRTLYYMMMNGSNKSLSCKCNIMAKEEIRVGTKWYVMSFVF